MNVADTMAWLQGKASFARGIHPPTRKQPTINRPIEVLPEPESVVIPLHQHAGAAATSVVKPRQSVSVGELIGTTEAPITAGVHASIAGRVQPLTAVNLPNGRHSQAVAIRRESSGKGEISGERPAERAVGRSMLEELFGGDWHPEQAKRFFPHDIVAKVKQAGIVGLGGAAFPTHIKLTPNPTRPVDTLLLNGCECEPYLTADYRIMVEAPRAIVTGLLLAMKAAGAQRGVIALEDNKPAAAEALLRAASELDDQQRVRVIVCQTKYPMGGERQLIPAVLGYEVPTGGFPLDVGIVVMNVGTAAAVATAVLRGHAMTHRVVTVSGLGIREPKNLLAPIGTSLQHLVDYCGGLTSDACRVLAGGPMMGFTVTDLSIPLTKGTSGLTVLSEPEVARAEPTACIRCGRCLDVCPLGLSPTRIAHAARHGDVELAKQYDLMACCECGCCAYVCPAHIPLAQFIRTAKLAELRRRDREKRSDGQGKVDR